MSAPWEVWAGRNGYISLEPNPKLRVDGYYERNGDKWEKIGLIRYIRADLRCEDCEKWHTDMVISAEGYLQHSPGCETYPCRFIDDPACMEIIPKEVQP